MRKQAFKPAGVRLEVFNNDINGDEEYALGIFAEFPYGETMLQIYLPRYADRLFVTHTPDEAVNELYCKHKNTPELKGYLRETKKALRDYVKHVTELRKKYNLD